MTGSTLCLPHDAESYRLAAVAGYLSGPLGRQWTCVWYGTLCMNCVGRWTGGLCCALLGTWTDLLHLTWLGQPVAARGGSLDGWLWMAEGWCTLHGTAYNPLQRLLPGSIRIWLRHGTVWLRLCAAQLACLLAGMFASVWIWLGYESARL
jgi:hypothetical protein